MPPCPSEEPDPTIPGPGPHTAASQPSVRRPWCSAPAVRDRLALAPVCRARRQVPGEQAALAQRAHDPRVPAGQRPARRSARTPGRASGLACANAHATAASWPCRASTATGFSSGSRSSCLVEGLHRMLEARVVELHHVGARHALPPQTAREVDVHDVKATRAEAEVARLHVDDHIVARTAGPTKPTSAIAAGARRRVRSVRSCSGPSAGPA